MSEPSPGGGITATHYEILGVAPDASHDEVKGAYLDLALRFHPDRQADPGGSALDRASFRLQEVNDAWRVLRNPAARAHYDDLLRSGALDDVQGGRGGEVRGAGGATVTATRVTVATGRGVDMGGRSVGAPPPGANPFAPTEAEAAELDPDTSAPPPETPRRIRWAPLIVGGAVLVVVLLWAAVAQRQDDPGIKIQTVERFGIGTCLALVGEGGSASAVSTQRGSELAEPVACDGDFDFLVIERVDFPRPCPRGQAMVLLEEQQVLCVQPR